ncbi:MAG: peptide deformylase [Tannerella sp.]|nr:peptide deformylase [Tannerella sp.]
MMKSIKTCLVIAGIVLLPASCGTIRPFSEAEGALIVSGGAEVPFRVLQITDRQDSVLLRTPCGKVRNFAGDPAFRLLIERLKTTLEAENGAGIAAPQVGISKSVFLFMRTDLPGLPVHVAVNPRIVNHPDTTVCFERDGCLSIPDRSGNSVRYPWIDVEYWNEKGEKVRERLDGYSRRNSFTAIIFQHEYDHTKGVLFTDKLCE